MPTSTRRKFFPYTRRVYIQALENLAHQLSVHIKSLETYDFGDKQDILAKLQETKVMLWRAMEHLDRSC